MISESQAPRIISVEWIGEWWVMVDGEQPGDFQTICSSISPILDRMSSFLALCLKNSETKKARTVFS